MPEKEKVQFVVKVHSLLIKTTSWDYSPGDCK